MLISAIGGFVTVGFKYLIADVLLKIAGVMSLRKPKENVTESV